MVYDLIFNELSNVIGIFDNGWQLTTLQIVSMALSIFYILFFMSIPLKLFNNFLMLFNDKQTKKRRKNKNETIF